jgi:threonine dehydratase
MDLGRAQRAGRPGHRPRVPGQPQFAPESLSTALGRQVLVKVETLNPLRSFKGRGAQFLAARLDTGGATARSSPASPTA